jgi:hypothetical protein
MAGLVAVNLVVLLAVAVVIGLARQSLIDQQRVFHELRLDVLEMGGGHQEVVDQDNIARYGRRGRR